MEQTDRILSAADILGIDDVTIINVPVPEWKGTVRLKTLSAESVAEYLEAIDGPAKRNAIVLMFMRSAVDGDGNLLFKDADTLHELKRRSMRAYMRVQKQILELNGLDDKTTKSTETKNG